MDYAISNSDSLNQRIHTVMTIDGESRNYDIKLRYGSAIGKWLMTIFDDSGNAVVRNIPLVAGTNERSANLLYQLAYMRLGSAFALPVIERPSTENPGKNNLGADKEFALVWSDTR